MDACGVIALIKALGGGGGSSGGGGLLVEFSQNAFNKTAGEILAVVRAGGNVTVKFANSQTNNPWYALLNYVGEETGVYVFMFSDNGGNTHALVAQTPDDYPREDA